jgi:hypothetical protein
MEHRRTLASSKESFCHSLSAERSPSYRVPFVHILIQSDNEEALLGCNQSRGAATETRAVIASTPDVPTSSPLDRQMAGANLRGVMTTAIGRHTPFVSGPTAGPSDPTAGQKRAHFEDNVTKAPKRSRRARGERARAVMIAGKKLDQSVKKLDQAEEYKRKAEEVKKATELERQAEAHVQSLQ